MGIFINNLQNQIVLVNSAVKMIESNYQNYQSRRQDLIDYVVSYLAPIYSEDGFTRSDIRELVIELLARHETDDHGWYIDASSSTSDEIYIRHPQRPDRTITLNKRFALLPFDLLA